MTQVVSNSDYVAAVQHPREVFNVPRLQEAVFPTGMLGVPQCFSGNAAVVFKAQIAGSDCALRFYTRPEVSSRERYTLLMEHFRVQGLTDCVATAEWYDDAITLDGQTLPALEMQWVPGQTLRSQVDDLVEEGDSAGLLVLASRFRALVGRLQAAEFAHGDLSQDNVLVDTSGTIRLVDFDGCWTAALMSGGAPIEVGNPDFQHPGRHWDRWMDTFPALVVYTSLLAVAERPALWQEYHTQSNLLFTAADYTDLTRPLWWAMSSLQAPNVRTALARLTTLLRSPHPPQASLEAVLDGRSEATSGNAETVAPPPSAPAPKRRRVSVKKVIGWTVVSAVLLLIALGIASAVTGPSQGDLPAAFPDINPKGSACVAVDPATLSYTTAAGERPVAVEQCQYGEIAPGVQVLYFQWSSDSAALDGYNVQTAGFASADGHVVWTADNATQGPEHDMTASDGSAENFYVYYGQPFGYLVYGPTRQGVDTAATSAALGLHRADQLPATDPSASRGSMGPAPTLSPQAPSGLISEAFPDTAAHPENCNVLDPRTAGYKTAAGETPVAIEQCQYSALSPGVQVLYFQWANPQAALAGYTELTAGVPALDSGPPQWTIGPSVQGPKQTELTSDNKTVGKFCNYTGKSFGFMVSGPQQGVQDVFPKIGLLLGSDLPPV